MANAPWAFAASYLTGDLAVSISTESLVACDVGFRVRGQVVQSLIIPVFQKK